MTETARTTHDRMVEMFNSSVRVEGMWPFPVSPASEGLMELFDGRDVENMPEEIQALLKGWGEVELDDLFCDAHNFYDAFDELCGCAFRRNVHGFIGQIATPVLSWGNDGKSASFSWGHYHTKIIFAPTADDFLDKAIAWADEISERGRTEAAE